MKSGKKWYEIEGLFLLSDSALKINFWGLLVKNTVQLYSFDSRQNISVVQDFFKHPVRILGCILGSKCICYVGTCVVLLLNCVVAFFVFLSVSPTHFT